MTDGIKVATTGERKTRIIKPTVWALDMAEKISPFQSLRRFFYCRAPARRSFDPAERGGHSGPAGRLKKSFDGFFGSLLKCLTKH